MTPQISAPSAAARPQTSCDISQPTSSNRRPFRSPDIEVCASQKGFGVLVPQLVRQLSTARGSYRLVPRLFPGCAPVPRPPALNAPTSRDLSTSSLLALTLGSLRNAARRGDAASSPQRGLGLGPTPLVDPSPMVPSSHGRGRAVGEWSSTTTVPRRMEVTKKSQSCRRARLAVRHLPVSAAITGRGVRARSPVERSVGIGRPACYAS